MSLLSNLNLNIPLVAQKIYIFIWCIISLFAKGANLTVQA